MNEKERQEFIEELIENIKADIITENSKYSDDWNGIELRQRIADMFSQCIMKGTMSKKRKKDYNNFVLVNGLR